MQGQAHKVTSKVMETDILVLVQTLWSNGPEKIDDSGQIMILEKLIS